MIITWWMIPIGGFVGFLTYTSYRIAVGIKQGIFSEEIAKAKEIKTDLKKDWANLKTDLKKDWIDKGNKGHNKISSNESKDWANLKTDLKKDWIDVKKDWANLKTDLNKDWIDVKKDWANLKTDLKKGNKGHNKISSCEKILGVTLIFVIIAACAISLSSVWLWVVFGFAVFIASLFGIRNLFLRVDISTRKSIFVSMPEFFIAGMLLIFTTGFILTVCAGENTESVLFNIGIILVALPFALIAGILALLILATPLMVFLDWVFRRMMFFCFALTEDDFKDFGELWFDR